VGLIKVQDHQEQSLQVLVGFLDFASSVHNHYHSLWRGLVVLNLHLVKSRFEAYLAHGLTKGVNHLIVNLRLENLAFS
jgi:hypothetical protein